MGFSQAELQSFRNASVPDLVGPGLKLLFVGINPGLWTAATQTHFAHPGNRFYPALRLAGIVDRDLDRGEPVTEEDRAYLIKRGIGITNLVNRATARAGELAPDELRAGRTRLEDFVAQHHPAVVAIAGITAYRLAFAAPKAKEGEQAELASGARVWVVPNPSGLNAHETIASLAQAYAEPARVAGVISQRARALAPAPSWLAAMCCDVGHDFGRAHRSWLPDRAAHVGQRASRHLEPRPPSAVGRGEYLVRRRLPR